ncbi:hypothetical protein [Phormidesmis sp. 146-33]
MIRYRFLNLSLSVQVVLVGLASLMGAAPLQAAQTISNSQPQPNDRLLAQTTQNYCKKEESLFITAETKNFWVSICGSGDTPYTYVGVSKKDRKSIRLPLKDYDRRGNYFQAVNKEFVYILAKTPKGNFLTVTNTKTKRELLREPVLKGW